MLQVLTKISQKYYYLVVTVLLPILINLYLLNFPAYAADLNQDLLKQPVIEVAVNLSNSTNELKFEPNHFDFTPGKRYKLRLANPSTQKHYFTARDFANAIWTQKVETGGVEVKGDIQELELKPKAEAEWIFVPIKTGKYTLRCPIMGHTEAGMTGEIVIGKIS